MKKIIAILLALAVVSMAFAQTFSMENTVETRPTVYVNGGTAAWEWNANGTSGAFLSDIMKAVGETGDGRAKFQGAVVTYLKVTDPNGAGLLNILPRIGITTPALDHIAGSYKAADFLAFGFGTGHLSYAVGGYLGGAYDMPGPDGAREGGASFTDTWQAWNSANYWTGAFVTFLGDGVGVDGFKASLVFNDDWLNKNSFSFGVHAKYDADIFAASAKYDGTFGANNSAFTLPNKGIAERKGDYTHEFAVGVNYKGLKDLAVGIDLGAAFDAILSKDVNGNSTKMSVGLGSTFDFRNGITNKVWGRVGFGTVYGKSYKVLPFGFGDELTYAIGGDYNSKFIFEIAYLQNGMDDKLKSKLATDPNTADIYVYPSFSFTMGKSDFLFGVKNDITGHLTYTEKTADDWAHTKVFGDGVKVQVPVKWTYHF